MTWGQASEFLHKLQCFSENKFHPTLFEALYILERYYIASLTGSKIVRSKQVSKRFVCRWVSFFSQIVWMISSSFSAVVVCVCSEVKYFILLLVVLLYTLLVAEKLPLKVVLLSRYGSTSEMALSSWFYRPICKSRRFPDEKYALFIGPTTIKSLLRPFCDHKPLNCINDGPTKVERNEGATHIYMYTQYTLY